MRHCQEDPEDPEDTHAGTGHDHWDQHVAHTPQCTGQDLNKNEKHIRGRDDPYDLHADPDNFRVCSKQLEKVLSQKQQQGADQQGSNKVQEQADFDTFLHTVVFACAVVLTDESYNGNTEGSGDHPVDSVDLAKSSIGSHSVRSQIIERSLDDNIGNIIHDRLDTGRKSDGDDGYQQKLVKTYFPGFQTVHICRLHKGVDDQNGADYLGDHCSYGSSCHSHIKAHHQKDIQKDIDKAADDQEVQRPGRISYSS